MSEVRGVNPEGSAGPVPPDPFVQFRETCTELNVLFLSDSTEDREDDIFRGEMEIRGAAIMFSQAAASIRAENGSDIEATKLSISWLWHESSAERMTAIADSVSNPHVGDTETPLFAPRDIADFTAVVDMLAANADDDDDFYQKLEDAFKAQIKEDAKKYADYVTEHPEAGSNHPSSEEKMLVIAFSLSALRRYAIRAGFLALGATAGYTLHRRHR